MDNLIYLVLLSEELFIADSILPHPDSFTSSRLASTMTLLLDVVKNASSVSEAIYKLAWLILAGTHEIGQHQQPCTARAEQVQDRGSLCCLQRSCATRHARCRIWKAQQCSPIQAGGTKQQSAVCVHGQGLLRRQNRPSTMASAFHGMKNIAFSFAFPHEFRDRRLQCM